MKLKLVINLTALKCEDYIKCCLIKIDFVKTLFLYDIEMGIEVFIPPELSMDHLPRSFRYYDPIF